jgi:NADH-quinone oxidoreductase subunit G
MVVHTRTEQVKHAQSAVVEFLLVNHPLDCPVCDKGGECPLQDITQGWGPGKSRVIDEKRHFPKPIELSPLVAIDRERCILCYRCVRFSQEVSEDDQLQLLERGDRTFVGTFDDRPYVAPFHGNITDICPVGALTNYTYRFRARPWDIEEAGSVCTICPSQCNVSFTVRDEQVKRVLTRDNAEVDDGWICDRGRYGFEMFGAEERVRGPRLKGSGEADWAAAIAAAAEGLRAAADIDHTRGGSMSAARGSRVAAIVGDASNEEGYLVQRLVREVLGSPHVDSRPSRGPVREQIVRLAQPQLSAKVRDIDEADVIFVLGTDPLHSSPILDLRVRKAIRRNGARLVVATERPTALDGGAEAIARYAPGGAGAFLSELAAAAATPSSLGTSSEGGGIAGALEALPSSSAKRSEGVAAAAEVLRDAERAVVVWGERIGREAGGVEALLEVAAALGLAEKDGAGLLEIPDTTNARGLREAGCLPDAGPGLSDARTALTTLSGANAVLDGKSTEGIRDALASGEIEALILFGADPLRDFPDTPAWEAALTACKHLVVFSMHENATTAKADVVFPLETHAEKDGTVTHPDGRLQRVRPSAARPGSVRSNIAVLSELASALGDDSNVDSQPKAFAALRQAVSFYADIDDSDIAGRGIRWQDTPSAASVPQASAGAPSERFAEEEGSAPKASAAQDSDDEVPSEEGAPALALGTYRDLWAGPITELNPPLKFLTPRQRVEISPVDAERLGLKSGETVRVGRDGSKVEAEVQIKDRVAEGVCFLAEGVSSGNANALLNGGPVKVEIEKLSEARS